MNPKPLSAMNHLTVPSATFSPSWEPHRGAGWRTGAAMTDFGLRPRRLSPEKRKRPPSLPRAFKSELNTYEETTTATLSMLSALRISGNRPHLGCLPNRRPRGRGHGHAGSPAPVGYLLEGCGERAGCRAVRAGPGYGRRTARRVRGHKPRPRLIRCPDARDAGVGRTPGGARRCRRAHDAARPGGGYGSRRALAAVSARHHASPGPAGGRGERA